MTKQELALAEQSEKMRETLRRIRSGECPANYPLTLQGLTNFHVTLAKEALSLPDLATPVLNRIKAEGMREAAMHCSKHGSRTADEVSEDLFANADELEQRK